jgi:hypothetical protein
VLLLTWSVANPAQLLAGNIDFRPVFTVRRKHTGPQRANSLQPSLRRLVLPQVPPDRFQARPFLKDLQDTDSRTSASQPNDRNRVLMRTDVASLSPITHEKAGAQPLATIYPSWQLFCVDSICLDAKDLGEAGDESGGRLWKTRAFYYPLILLGLTWQAVAVHLSYASNFRTSINCDLDPRQGFPCMGF